MDRKNAEVLNELTAPPISKVKPDVPTHHFDELPVFFDQDSAQSVVGEELGTYAYDALKSRPLNQQIQHEILEDIKRAKEEEEYKKALATALINKAKNQGYDLEVDEDYKIKSVRKIRTQNPPSIFDPGAVPSQ
jgi:hypothetical protein